MWWGNGFLVIWLLLFLCLLFIVVLFLRMWMSLFLSGGWVKKGRGYSYILFCFWWGWGVVLEGIFCIWSRWCLWCWWCIGMGLFWLRGLRCSGVRWWIGFWGRCWLRYGGGILRWKWGDCVCVCCSFRGCWYVRYWWNSRLIFMMLVDRWVWFKF